LRDVPAAWQWSTRFQREYAPTWQLLEAAFAHVMVIEKCSRPNITTHTKTATTKQQYEVEYHCHTILYQPVEAMPCVFALSGCARAEPPRAIGE
jgi:hypothetical protein